MTFRTFEPPLTSRGAETEIIHRTEGIYPNLGKEVDIETSIKYYEKSQKADPAPWADIIRDRVLYASAESQ